VTDSDGQTKLNYEREYYDSTTGELVLWIKTDISSTTNKDLYIYYGNSGVTEDQATTTGVWDDDYVTVHHLSETSGTHYDSTGNHDGTPTFDGSGTEDAVGQMDGAEGAWRG